MVGKIVNTHGLRGEVRVITVSDFADTRYAPGNILYFFANEDDQNGQALAIASHRTHKQFDLITFDGYPSINDVQHFKGGVLKIRSEDRQHDVELDENEYYFDQIIGCSVRTERGDLLGVVQEIMPTGANDVWVVQPAGGGKDLLIPYIEDVVRNVDIDEQEIIVRLIDGLVE